MKVLLVYSRIPYPPIIGGDVRIYNLIKRLSPLVEISLLCKSDERFVKDAEFLRPYCKNIYIVPVDTQRPLVFKIARLFKWSERKRNLTRIKMFLSGVPVSILRSYLIDFSDKLKAIIESDNFDIIQFEFLETGLYALDLLHLVRTAGKGSKKIGKMILVEHDITSVMVDRMWKYASFFRKISLSLSYMFLKKYEKKLFLKFDQIIAMSDLDREKLVRAEPRVENITVIKSGVDLKKHLPVKVACPNPRLVFLGTMKFIPNRDGVEWFLNKIFPIIKARIPEVVVDVIGEEATDLTRKYQSDQVKFHGVVEPLGIKMQKDSIFICPVRIGAGTKLKIVTAMAFGIPIVSTSIGVEGIDAQETEGVVVADTEQTFARAVLSLWEDIEKRKLFGKRARAFVEREFDWDEISKKMIGCYTSMVAENQ